jgi:hypothetical protein
MQLPKIGNLWLVLAVLFVGLMFMFSPPGKDLQLFLFGNTCGAGFIHENNACVPAQVQLSCGAGTYLGKDIGGLYSCKLSNFSFLLIAMAIVIAAYFYFMRKMQEVWRPAKDCFKDAFNKGHLLTEWQEEGADDYIRAYQRVRETHQIVPHNGWLFIGEFLRPGMQDSVLIAGTDQTGWVLDSWQMRLDERQIQTLKKQGMKLDTALAEVAQANLRIKQAQEAFKTEEEATQ